MFDVITVGSATVDVFARTDSELIKIKTMQYEEELIAYPCGSKILMNELHFLTGGGGTNVAVSLSKLGHKVAYLGKVGNDANAETVLKTLRNEKVKFIGKKSIKFLTGYSVILDSLEGDRTILAHKGANNFLHFYSIDKSKLKTKWFYFSSMMEDSYETLEKLAEYAVENNIKVAFNPSNYLAVKGKEFLGKLLRSTYLLILNREEAGLIVGKNEISDMIQKIMELGPKIVVVTEGKRGAYTISEDHFYQIVPGKIKAKETTGAGDSFASGFLSGYIQKLGIRESLKLGIVVAQSVIQKIGAKEGLITKEEAKTLMKKNKYKIIKKKLENSF